METRKCPACGKANAPGERFCQQCGAALGPPGVADAPSPPAQLNASTAGVPGPANLPPVRSGRRVPATSAPPRRTAPSAPRSEEIGQLGSAGRTVSLWGPFAGYGTRRDHTAWLLRGLGERAEELRNSVTEVLRQRRIPDAEVRLTTITGQGVAVEKRPYYRVRRGLSTVWLYVARFGHDLYVSQVAYIKGPISVLRVLVLGALVLMSVISITSGLIVYDVVSSALQGTDALRLGKTVELWNDTVEQRGSLIQSFLCCTGPLGMISILLLTLVVVFSVYKFVAEKDILAVLRAPPNEFQEDDIVSLEKAVNETVRLAADRIEIDLDLLAPDRAHQARPRLL